MKFVSIAISLLAIQAPPIVEGQDTGNIAVRYFNIGSGNSVVPDMSGMPVDESEYVPNINYGSTRGSFVGSGFADNVGAIFEGCIAIPDTGEWTFYTESDDGSRMYINDEEVVNNDGLHGMETQSGSIELDAVQARARVTFFENGGGAGLIVSWQGPGVEKQIIPASAWVPCGYDYHPQTCVNSSNLSDEGVTSVHACATGCDANDRCLGFSIRLIMVVDIVQDLRGHACFSQVEIILSAMEHIIILTFTSKLEGTAEPVHMVILISRHGLGNSLTSMVYVI